MKDWKQRLDAASLNQEDLNKLVMNFLVLEGYQDVAEKFQKESGTKPEIPLESIKDRMEIRKAVQSGNITAGIEKVNDLNPEILDTQPSLYFHLQQQRLLELLRNDRIEQALQFAQQQLAPRALQQPDFLEEMEKIMLLLAFGDKSASPTAQLLAPEQRAKVASELNDAILSSQSQNKPPRLCTLLKRLVWAQRQLDTTVDFPKIACSDFVTATLKPPSPPPVPSTPTLLPSAVPTPTLGPVSQPATPVPMSLSAASPSTPVLSATTTATSSAPGPSTPMR
jgi:hypothetical protein